MGNCFKGNNNISYSEANNYDYEEKKDIEIKRSIEEIDMEQLENKIINNIKPLMIKIIKSKKNPDFNHKLSSDIINEYVQKLINDENINIDYLPNFIEKTIYKNIFTILIGVINNLIDTTEIKFLNHNITLNIEPDY